MFCKRCGMKVEKDSKFCVKCGTAIKSGTNYMAIMAWIIIIIIISLTVNRFTKSHTKSTLVTEVEQSTDISIKENKEVVKPENDLEKMSDKKETLTGGKLTPLDYFENMQENKDMPYTLGEQARNFLRNHSEFFYNNEEKVYEAYIDKQVTFKQLDKDINAYGENLIQVTGTLVDMEQIQLARDVDITGIQIIDESSNNYYIFYIGELDKINRNVVVDVCGLPIGNSSFENIGGGSTKVVVLAGVDVNISRGKETKPFGIEEDTSDKQVVYKDAFTQDIVGFDVYDYVNSVFQEVIQIAEFLYDYDFEIVSGDEGYFKAVNDSGITLNVSTKRVQGGYSVDFFEANIIDYTMTLEEVEAICNPDGNKELTFDEDLIASYYSKIIGHVEVRYNFTFDELHMDNPKTSSITILIQ